MNLTEKLISEFNISEKEAAGLIMSGKAYVNGVKCVLAKTILKPDDTVTLKQDDCKFATRSGYKLEKALIEFGLDAKTVCMDIGASGGGFTDCMLKNGAIRVYAVDVAYGILDWEIRKDPRVVVIERTNARYLTKEHVPELCGLVTIDVSFISITKILPNIKDFMTGGASIAALFKPQFELPKKYLTKNGLVSDPEQIVLQILQTIHTLSENGLFVRDIIESPIKGSNGNIEYLLHIKASEDSRVDEAKVRNAVGLEMTANFDKD